MEWMNETPTGVELKIHAVPRASKNEIQGLHNNALKVRLTTPPVDGKANQALIKFLSKTLGIPNAQIQLLRGKTTRYKTVRIHGLSKETLTEKLVS